MDVFHCFSACLRGVMSRLNSCTLFSKEVKKVSNKNEKVHEAFILVKT